MKYGAKLFTLMIITFACVAANAQRPLMGGIGPQQQRIPTGSISGRIRAIDGNGVDNARVEVRGGAAGENVAATYTNNSGAFEIANLPPGDYEIVVTQGLEQIRDRVSVQNTATVIELRMAGNPAPGNGHTVSIAEMKIPEKARNHFRKADAAMRKGKYDEAAQEVEKALEAAPAYANALTLRAVLRLDSNQSQPALDDLQKALNSDPNYAMAYIVSGAVYNYIQQFDNAIRSLERGIALDPTSWQGYFELSKALLAKQNYEASLRNANKAFDLAPKDYPPLHLVRAHIYLGLKNYDQAMAELEGYLEHAPKDPTSEQARKTLDQVRAFVATKK